MNLKMNVFLWFLLIKGFDEFSLQTTGYIDDLSKHPRRQQVQIGQVILHQVLKCLFLLRKRRRCPGRLRRAPEQSPGDLQ